MALCRKAGDPKIAAGFWIVINHILDFDIVRSGDSMPKMTNIAVSDDFRSLTFNEGDRWRHELTLNNKYEAKLRECDHPGIFD